MSDFATRIRAVRLKLGMNQKEFAKHLDVSVGSVGNWEVGKQYPHGKKLKFLADKLGLETAYLMGEDQGISDSVVKSQDAPPYITNPVSNAREAPLWVAKPRNVPVVSWALAGAAFSADFADNAAQINEWVETDCKDPNCYALIVEGDSMVPEFRPGDRVIVSPNSEARPGDFVVAKTNTHDAFIKRFRPTGRDGHVIRLESLNENYSTIEHPRERFRFIHPIVGAVRKYWR